MDNQKVTKILEIQVDKDKAVNAMAKLREEIAKVKDAENALTKELKENEKTQQLSSEQVEEKQRRLEALREAEKDYRAELSEVSRAVQNTLKADRSKSGSLKQLRAELSNLVKQYDELSRTEREGAQGEELLQHINELTTEIKDAEYASQRFQRNVGNYPDAVKPVKQELREITEQLIQLRAEGKANTEEYQQMVQRAGELKDAMADTQSEVNQLASDTGDLNSVLDAGKLAAGAFSAALGVMNLAGDKDSETAQKLAEAQKKLQAAIAITTGLQAVQNSLQKESALMMGIHKIQIWAAAKAQDAYTAATGRATIAQRLFNTVAKANPYVLLATAILSVVGALVAFNLGEKETEEQTKAVNDELSEQVKVIKALRGEYEAAYNINVKNKQNEIELLKAQGASIEAIQQAEDELYSIEAENIAQQKQDYQDLIDNLDEYKGQVNDLSNTIRDNAEKQHEMYADLEALQNGYFINFQKYPMLLGKAHDEQVKILQEMYNWHVSIGQAAIEEMNTLQGNINTAEKIMQDEADLTNKRLIQIAERDRQRQADAEARRKKAEEDRKKEEEEQKRYQELTLAEMQKAEDALNALIADEFEQRRAIEDTAYQRKVDALKKSMKEEEDAHGTDTELYRSYLSQLESLRLQHEQTMSNIAQDQFQSEKELRDRAIRQLESDNELYWQNRINEVIAEGQEAGQLELEMLQDQLNNMSQYVDESDAEFYARRLQKQIEYNNKKKELNQAEMAMEKAKQEYMASIAGSISSLLETVAGENKELVKASKIVALAEVAIKQGVAIAEAVASAAAGDPYTYALRVAAAIASTVAAMATAIQSISSVKLARGTAYVKGPGTSTSDSIPAMLSLGEGVVNARGNALFPGLVAAINDIGNGISVPASNQTTYNYTTVANAAGGITPDQIADAMSQMPPSEVAVTEIKRVNDRINVVENLRNY